MNAREYIASLRSELGSSIVYETPRSEWVAMMERICYSLERTGIFSKEQIQEMKDTTARETPAEALDRYIERMRNAISSEFRTIGHMISRLPEIGLLPTRDFNAWAMQVPNGEDVCILDEFLFPIIGCIAGSTCEYVFRGKEQVEGDRTAALSRLLGALIWFSGRAIRR